MSFLKASLRPVFSGVGLLSHFDPIFFFVALGGVLPILTLYMARIYGTAKSTLALRHRKRLLLSLAVGRFPGHQRQCRVVADLDGIVGLSLTQVPGLSLELGA
jgi:hypothetical protein